MQNKPLKKWDKIKHDLKVLRRQNLEFTAHVGGWVLIKSPGHQLKPMSQDESKVELALQAPERNLR